MNFTPEQIAKAKAAKSAEELLALAKENGIEMTEEEAKKHYAEWHKEGELADDELDNVAGGCGDDSDDTPTGPKYKEGQKFVHNTNRDSTLVITGINWSMSTDSYYVYCATVSEKLSIKETYTYNSNTITTYALDTSWHLI